MYQHKDEFQYISCYSLSFLAALHKFQLFSFQYISCYSLSVLSGKVPLGYSMFQYISCYSLSPCCCPVHSPLECFNTSHVTLYRRLCVNLLQLSVFQYISCYSLSLYFTAFLTPNIFIIPQNTMHCKIFTRRLDNSLFWD